MRRFSYLIKSGIAIICSVSFSIGFSQELDVTEAARQFLNSLPEKIRGEIQYDVKDPERLNWHYIPRSRKGISFHDLTEKQRETAMALLKVSLSMQGYNKVTAIIELEGILRALEDRGSDDTYRDPLNYYFTIFGTPEKNKPWGWRLEGHHISLNFVSINGTIESSTPSFLGANPAIVPRGPEKGKQILKPETELGFKLVNLFTAEQRKKAIFSENAPREIISGSERKAKRLEPKGISFNEMNKSQQEVFLQLLETYVKNYSFGFADGLMAKIEKAGRNNLHFAWAGATQPSQGHYYRIQGPMLLIEYDNTQNNANHVHTVVRDLTNDFAEDILGEHYEREHTK